MKTRMTIKDELFGTALIFAVALLALYGLAQIFEVAFQ